MDPATLTAALITMLTTYGPLALGWIIAFYLGKFVLDRYNADIESRVKLATAVEALAKSIEDRRAIFDRIEAALNRRDA